MATIELRRVSKQFTNGQFALRDVNLTIPHGQLTTLLGSSGCGKSTLLRLVAGLSTATDGEIHMDGRNVEGLSAADRQVGVVFQNYALFPHLDVQGNVTYGLQVTGVAPAACRQRAEASLALVGLQGFERRAIASLSGGQQQRVALARALVMEPAVLLLDEPLSNLDAGLRRQVREDIRALQQRLNLTVIYVTHDQSESLAVSDQVVVMHNGAVLSVGSPRAVYTQPQDERVAAFMGDATVLEAALLADGSVALGPLVLHDLLIPRFASRGGRVRLMVRPEAWRIEAATGAGLPAKVLRRAYLGRSVEYVMEVAWGELWVHAVGVHSLHQVGSPVSLSLSGHGVSVLSREVDAVDAATASANEIRRRA